MRRSIGFLVALLSVALVTGPAAAQGKPDLTVALSSFSGGTTPAARQVNGKLLPERAGYYLGHRMTETAVRTLGLDQAVRLAARDFEGYELEAAATA